MSASAKTTQALTAWINENRLLSPLLDDDADALLARLTTAAAEESALKEAEDAPCTIGLYGHSQAAKAHLLNALCGTGNGRLNVRPGDKTLDYFTHINPGHGLTSMALRFSPRTSGMDESFPLRLRILSEAELVQVFIAHARQQPELRAVDKSVIEDRVAKWRTLRQPNAVPGISALEIGAIARFWRSVVPSSLQHMDDALWHQFASLLPSLDLTARASAWSLLWGEQQELTQQWLSLAHTLHQTGNASELAAPLSVLVDNFALPTDGFLTPAEHRSEEIQDDVVVHPWSNDQLQNAVSVPLATLALITRELVLPVENSVLPSVDILDIPAPGPQEGQLLWRSKCRWLLDNYRQRLQPDVLMICNATAERAATGVTARALLNWVKETQSGQETALPGLVWAITPQDARFTQAQNLDEAVQQLIGKPGQHWGTLQALDASSLQRLLEWLAQATAPGLRQNRLKALTERHQQTLRDLLQSWAAAPVREVTVQRARAESVVRELQGQASRHGELLEGLLPDMQQFDTLWKVQQPREEKVSGLFNESIDLFAESAENAEQQPMAKDIGQQAHALWVNHVRQWSRNDDNAARLGISPAALRHMAETVIISSYRLNLPEQLQKVMQRDTACAAQLYAAIGNFVAWLGYADVPEDKRPASRVQKGSTIFASASVSMNDARLTKLSEQPVHAATRYVYDWLVALYHRATENIGYSHPLDVSAAARKKLKTLLP
ncbi:Coiled-coil structure [Enterobacter sp. FY-07]|uniref:virulence factor SrfC family protein n=1 Tax=Kosakonia oryzendophytica TaxID=1005665 RepID=UPI000777CA96|nr:virulence factor SrfC family protein [Kosakonia oryzendophytica]AMO49580.1 Coiled-coil structure [Enterobacter sp. FY-07]WBT60480.1 virulence factor SrfC family protein [Kosakonia oryzendophytica]